MLDEISSTQLAEWEYYWTEEPFGQVRNDFLLGTLVQVFYNAHRGKDSAPLKLQDILKPPPPATAETDVAYLEALIATGKVIDMRRRKK